MSKLHAVLLVVLVFSISSSVLIRNCSSGASKNELESGALYTQSAADHKPLEAIDPKVGSKEKNLRSSGIEPEKIVEESQEERYQALNKNPNFPSIESRMKEIESRPVRQLLSVEELLDVMAKPEVWDSVEIPTLLPEFAKNLKFPNPKFISFNRAKVESLVVGDAITIPIEEERESYEITIDEVKHLSGGNITWRGYIELDGNRHYASLTQNNRGLTVGGITTPNGHFTFEAQGDIGWVAESHSVFYDAGDEPDYIIPY